MTAALLALAGCADGITDPMESTGPRPAPPSLVETTHWTRYTSDWSSYASGVQPAGWIQMWDPTPFFKVSDEPGATGGKVLSWSAQQASRNRWALAYDSFGAVGDQEVYTEFRVRSLGAGSTFYMGSAAVRISGTAVDERGYAVFMVSNNGGTLRSVVLSSWLNGAYRQLGQLSLPWVLDEWYAIRLQAVGSQIRAKIWPRALAEPSGWHISVTDTLYATGRPGVSHHDNGTVQWDVWSGATPPLATPTGITLVPGSTNLTPGANQQFSASATYSDGSTLPMSATFTASGGTITPAGLYTAGSATGTFSVIATAPSLGFADTVAVIINPATIPGTYSTGFADQEPGLFPSGWTETSAPAGSDWSVQLTGAVNDGRVLRNVTTALGRHILRYGGVADSTTTQEVLTRMRMGDDDSRGPGVALRHRMTPLESAYVAYLRPGLNVVEVNAFVNGAWSLVGSAPFPNDAGSWYWLRFRAEGSSLRVKVWLDGQAEPAGWTYVGSNSALASGSAGLYTYEPNTIDYDGFSVGMGGHSAPPVIGSGGATPPTLAQLVLTPATSNLQPGQTVQFSASGIMTDGNSITLTPGFTAAGGSITPAGLYTAGGAAGSFSAIAMDAGSGRADTTLVVITLPAPLTASFATHFGRDPLGVIPPGWPETAYPNASDWSTATVGGTVDGVALRNVSTATGRHILRLDAIPSNSTDAEILVRMRLADDDNRGPGVALRHSMNPNESAYVAYLRPISNLVEINAFLNGVWTSIGAAGFVNDPGTWYWLRFRVQGTSLRVRAWPDGQVEPATWTYSGAHSGLTTGAVGLYTYEPNTTDYDLVSVVTGGGTAPVPAP